MMYGLMGGICCQVGVAVLDTVDLCQVGATERS